MKMTKGRRPTRQLIAAVSAAIVLLVISGCPEASLLGLVDEIETDTDGDGNGGGVPSQYESPNIGTMKRVPGGTYQRDDTDTNITTVSAFYIGVHQITGAEFETIMGTDPSDKTRSRSANDPVQRVSWYDAIAFCNKLSIAEGKTTVYGVSGIDWATLLFDDIPTDENATWNAATMNTAANGYRLPTEAEWMWAAIGATSGHGYGGSGTYTTGWQKAFAGSDGSSFIADYAVYQQNSGPDDNDEETRSTRPVGSKLPNELGVYDMSGNVWEWTWDWWQESYPSGTLSDPTGPTSGSSRVRRGGSWDSPASNCAVAGRIARGPFNRNNYLGVRVVSR
ncbi:MAG: hypothetical protein EA383_05300 [Spirochaetaceae bacterium]|nr:MAG: hypothetical protein EA383_05300 [Spirochaetaceae bacterium]